MKKVHACPIDGQGHNGYVAVDDTIGVKSQISFVLVDTFAAGHIHVIALGDEIVGKIMAAHAGNANALAFGNNVNIISVV